MNKFYYVVINYYFESKIEMKIFFIFFNKNLWNISNFFILKFYFYERFLEYFEETNKKIDSKKI